MFATSARSRLISFSEGKEGLEYYQSKKVPFNQSAFISKGINNPSSIFYSSSIPENIESTFGWHIQSLLTGGGI